MVYRADENAVRDAKDAVDDAEYDVIKGDIQGRIDAYDEEINKVNERYETEIDNLERLENEWQKALALQERAVNAVNFESMFGEGSISNLLAGDLSMVTTWKQTYLDTLGEIDIVSNGAIGEITAQYAELAGLNLTNVTEQAKTVVSQFDALNEAVGNVNSAIGAVSGESSDNG